ncbi:nuclear transport factor 2 family protein [Salinisphaera aquimarina]|uniref:Nuclear transport factor 2 family protein n=1 Tax=Salinisphaera aquimarina TaxID=2094031 RepID=A0ABV7EPN5_9GAMM
MAEMQNDLSPEQVLKAVFEAFNRHDADGVMSYMSDDIVFEAIAGDQAYGSRIEGQDAVKAAFEGVWANFPDVQWRDARHFACRDRGVSEWRFTATQPDGDVIEADGCDLFRFIDGKIVEKKAFRKNRPPVAAKA